jgi:outer membrane protein assembly factor BamB
MADIRTLNCPSCGAPISFAGRDARELTCRFCGSVIERTQERATAEDRSHALNIDLTGDHLRVDAPSGAESGARKFVIKMGDEQPIVVDMGSLGQGQVFYSSSTTSYSTGSDTIRTDVFSGTLPPTTRPVPPKQSSRRGLSCFAILATTVCGLGFAVPVVFFGLQDQLRSAFESFGVAVPDVPTIDNPIDQMTAMSFIPLGKPAYVNDEQGELVLMLGQFNNMNGLERHVLAVDPGQEGLAWQSEAIDGDLYSTDFAAGPDYVYYVQDKTLRALRRSDGAGAWQVSLSDELRSCDQGCLHVMDGALIAVTNDGVISGYEATSGERLWEFSFGNQYADFWVLADRPAVVDREDGKGVLRVFEPKTGAQTTVQPACQNSIFDEDLDGNGAIASLPNGDLLVAFGSFGICVQRLDAFSLQPVWMTSAGEDDRPETSWRRHLLTSAAWLALPTDSGALIMWDVNTGQEVSRVALEGAELVPLAIDGDTVLVRSQTSRGTTEYRLWAVDAPTGEILWDYDLGESQPIDIPASSSSILSEGDSAFTYAWTSETLTVVRVAAPETDTADGNGVYSVLPINRETGVAQDEIPVAEVPQTAWGSIVETSGVLRRPNNQLLLIANSRLVLLDTEQARVVRVWP